MSFPFQKVMATVQLQGVPGMPSDEWPVRAPHGIAYNIVS